jgi:hypothetical protein
MHCIANFNCKTNRETNPAKLFIWAETVVGVGCNEPYLRPIKKCIGNAIGTLVFCLYTEDYCVPIIIHSGKFIRFSCGFLFYHIE